MKTILIIALLINTTYSFAQKNDEMIFFKVKNDTIVFFLDDVGNITIKSLAAFYRQGQIDKKKFNYTGKIEDYYITRQKAYACYYQHGYLNGNVKCYYVNGVLKYNGFFLNSLKDSIWTFYYNNGNTEKIVLYNSSGYYLKEFFKRNGKNVFNDGNGKYKGSIISGYKQTQEYNISGHIKNGKIDGKWYWTGHPYYNTETAYQISGSTSAVEYFENGKFIKGSSYGLIYTSHPKITLMGFDFHENVDIFKFKAIPKSNERTFTFSQMLKYKGSNNLSNTFTKELSNYLIEMNKKNNLTHYWCFVQFIVTEKNEIENIIVYSNSKLISKDIEDFISGLKDFETVKPNNKAEDCAIYLCFFCDNGKLHIPEYSFDFNYNIMNLIPDK